MTKMSEDKKITPEVKNPETSEKVEDKGEKLLTQDQFNEALAERLERERRRLNKETDAKIKEVKEEAERLAVLSAEEKEKELSQKNEAEIKNRLKEVSLRENRLDAIESLVQAKVPTELVEYVVSEDKDETMENTETFIRTFNESVAKAVADQLKGEPPKDISANSNTQPVKVVKSF